MGYRTEQIRVLALFLAAGLGVSACGGRPDTAATSSAQSASSSSGGTDCAGMVNCVSSSSSSSSSSSGSTTLDPPLSFPFSLDGTGGTATSYTTPSINTDTILKVRITGGPAGPITVPDSNFSMNYNCVGYTVTVLGQTVTTKPLAVNGGNALCPDSEQVIDFHSRLIPGHGPVTVSVAQPRYDCYCALWYSGSISAGYDQSLPGMIYYSPYLAMVRPDLAARGYNMYCPLHTVYKTHTLTGQLDVQINGTTL